MAAAVRCINAWLERELAADGLLVAGEQQSVTDRTASHRWYLRFAGEEKDFITVWLTLRQRTLHHEAQFMPAPEENVEETFSLPASLQRQPVRHVVLSRSRRRRLSRGQGAGGDDRR